MKIEYAEEVPPEILEQAKNNRKKIKYDLSKLFSGEEKVAIIICESKTELKTAYNAVRQRLKYNDKDKEFVVVRDTENCKLYVYKE